LDDTDEWPTHRHTMKRTGESENKCSSDEANQLRQWLTDDRTLVRQCAFIMARRIAATHLAERQSAVQRLKLAALVSRNLSDFIGWKDATEKERGELSLASNQDKLTLVAAVLAVGLRTIENTGART